MEYQQKLNEKYAPVLLFCISSFKGSSCKKFQDIATSFLFLAVLHQFTSADTRQPQAQFSKSYMHSSFFAIYCHMLFRLVSTTGMMPLTITYHKYLHLPL